MEERENFVNCLVCGNRTKRFHFRVASCRACSVFFRRTVQLKKEYVCEFGARDCDLLAVNGQKGLCRYCRFEKCKKIGMKYEPDEKKHSTDNTGKNSPNTGNIIIDWKPVVHQVREIMAQSTSEFIPYEHTSFMAQISCGITNCLNALKPENLFVMENIFDRELFIDFGKRYWIELAKLLNYSEVFVKLDYKDKLRLYDHSRKISTEIFCCYLSILVFGYCLEDFRVVNDNGTVFDFTSMAMKMKNDDTNSLGKYAGMWVPIVERKLRYLLIPMKQIQITRLEVIYILSTILWDLQDTKDLSSNAHYVAEQMLRQIDNELHNYYVNKMCLTNYANRIGTLHRVAHAAKRFYQEQNELYTMAKIFNMFGIEIHDQELI